MFRLIASDVLPNGTTTENCSAVFRELLKTCCVGEFRACGARRTLGTCPVFAKPVGTNFARSRRFREVPFTAPSRIVGTIQRAQLTRRSNEGVISNEGAITNEGVISNEGAIASKPDCSFSYHAATTCIAQTIARPPQSCNQSPRPSPR